MIAMECTPKRRNGSIILVLLCMIGIIIGVILGVVLSGESGGGSSNDADGSSGSTTSTTTPSPIAFPTVSPTIPPTSPIPTVEETPNPTASSTISVLEVITSVALKGGEEFDDVGSYQSQALAFLRDTNAGAMYSESTIVQRYALACIYFSTFAVDNGFGSDSGWNRVNGWISEDSECTWEGVVCNEENQVTALDLGDNNLTGSLAAEIVLLGATLTRLDLTNNPTHHADGNEFWGQLVNLKQLLLSGTNFSNEEGVPLEFGLLTELQDLDCSFTLFSGALDGAVFENLANLQMLILSGNEYKSPLPEEIGRLEKLQVLRANQASLRGDLEDFDFVLPSITEVSLSDNPDLGGELPDWVGNLVTLQKLFLDSCDLEGTIPSTMGLLTDMKELDLSSNQLLGFIPSEMGMISNLSTFLLQENNLGGFMPSEVCTHVTSGTLTDLEADCISQVFCPCCSQCF